ncbi:MAG: GtrA family protein [Alphaproteobacteria bacterium]|nr:GtrA family protein [Alphaproteobacteria bacterium]
MSALRSQFFRYALCGGAGVASDYGFYLLTLWLDGHYQLANVGGYALGTLVSFFLNRVVTFGVRDRVGRRLALFFAVAGTGFAVSAGLLWLLVDAAGVGPALAKGATLPVVVALQFTLNRRITFLPAER